MESSGIDLSQASCTVQVNLGKRASSRRVPPIISNSKVIKTFLSIILGALELYILMFHLYTLKYHVYSCDTNSVSNISYVSEPKKIIFLSLLSLLLENAQTTSPSYCKHDRVEGGIVKCLRTFCFIGLFAKFWLWWVGYP